MNWFISQANHSFTSTQSSSFITAHKTYTLPPTSSDDRCNFYTLPQAALDPTPSLLFYYLNYSLQMEISLFLLANFAKTDVFVSFCRWMLFWPWGSCTISTYVFLYKSILSHSNKEKNGSLFWQFPWQLSRQLQTPLFPWRPVLGCSKGG